MFGGRRRIASAAFDGVPSDIGCRVIYIRTAFGESSQLLYGRGPMVPLSDLFTPFSFHNGRRGSVQAVSPHDIIAI